VTNAQLTRYAELYIDTGVALALLMNWPSIPPEVILGGSVSSLASTGMHQLFKQWIDSGGK